MNHKYKEKIKMVKDDEMPLFSYALIHRNAMLTQEQKEILVARADKLKRELNYAEVKN